MPRIKKNLYSIFLVVCLASCAKHGDFLYDTNRIWLSNVDNGGEKAVDSVNSVKSKAYAIRLNTHNVVSDYAGPNKDENESGYVRRYRLTDLKLYTLKAFDANHPAGSDVSAYFLYLYSSRFNIDYLLQERIMSYPKGRPNPETEFDEFYDFMLMQQPDSSGSYTFRLSLGFSDGSSFTDTTNVNLVNER